MSEFAPLTLSCRTDRKLAWEGGGSVRYIVVDAVVPEAPLKEASERLPLNLGVVIDASGSMSGGSLEAAKVAATGVAERLGARDTLSIVSFADDVLIHLDGIPMDAAGRGLAAAAIRTLETRGQTNLSGGWLKGAECVATVMERKSGLHNRVIVLSDGHANAGILDSREVGAHAEQLLARGLATSTVGIGDGYNPEFLRALAENGGGTMHDAEFAGEISEVLMAELGDVRNLAAENLRISVRCPDGVRVMALQAGEMRWGQEATMRFGAVTANTTKRAVFRVRTPRSEPGSEVCFEVTARWKAPGVDEEQSARAATVLTYAPGRLNSPQERDAAATLAAGEAWHAAILLHASRLNRARQWSEAKQYLEQELRFFRGYAESMPALLPLLEELEAVQRQAGRDWGERSRKEVEMLSYRRSQGKMESRLMARASSASALIGSEPPRRQTSIEYPLIFENEHWFTVVDGRRMLLDTGSPVSVGSGALVFAGSRTMLQGSFAGVSLDELVQLVGSPFDGLLGMDVLGTRRVSFDGKRGILRVGAALPGGLPEVATSSVMGVPTVPLTVDGVSRRAFIDLGAKVSYVSGGVAGAGEDIEDFYPGIGRFATQAGLATAEVAGIPMRLRFGSLPKLLQMNLMVAGCDAILGAEMLQQAVLHFDFAAGRLLVEA